MDRIKNGNQTIGDIDTVRKALRDQQNAFMRPAPGSMNARDPNIAREFGDLASKVEGIGVSTDPDYGKVLENYRGISRYAAGFEHGLKGNGITEIDPNDTLLAKNLKTAMGQAGYMHGNALHTASAALDAIAPGSVNPQSGLNAGHVAQGAMAASSGGISAVYHAMRAIPGLHLPEAVQQSVARQLNDPRLTAAGIKNLQRAGATNDAIRRFAAGLGTSVAMRINNALGSGQ